MSPDLCGANYGTAGVLAFLLFRGCNGAITVSEHLLSQCCPNDGLVPNPSIKVLSLPASGPFSQGMATRGDGIRDVTYSPSIRGLMKVPKKTAGKSAR